MTVQQIHIFQQAGNKPWRVVAQGFGYGVGIQTSDEASIEDAIVKAHYLTVDVPHGPVNTSRAATTNELSPVWARLDELAERIKATIERLDKHIADTDAIARFRQGNAPRQAPKGEKPE